MTALRTPKPTVDVMRLLNPWQHHFPLVAEPYADLARVKGESVGWVLAQLEEALRSGALSRIGGVFSAQAGGAALLAAMRVPLERLEAVAAQVSAHLGVNHNYEREADYNLWFVMTARCPQSLEESLQRIERETGLQVLRLRMIKPYRIDLGFDLTCAPQARLARSSRASQVVPSPIAAIDQPLAALVEEGLPLVERPFQVWADALGRSESSVLTTLATWVAQGTLRRFGTVVRHHELGFGANAMTVFDVPDAVVDVHGERLSQCPGVTLAYRRERATEWPFNLYCMVHGREREEVLQLIDALTHTCGLTGMARQVLFSRQRFKQVGGRRFRSIPEEAHHA